MYMYEQVRERVCVCVCVSIERYSPSHLFHSPMTFLADAVLHA